MANRGVNKTILIGNVGADPEVNFMANGNAVGNFRMATSETWKDKDSGEPQERTEWHRIVFYGKLAEIVEKLIKKGTQVYVEGSIQTRKWQDQSGEDRYTTEIRANVVNVLSNGKDMSDGSQGGQSQSQGGQSQGGQQQQPQNQNQNQNQGQGFQGQPSQPTHQQPANSGMDDFDDDIPF